MFLSPDPVQFRHCRSFFASLRLILFYGFAAKDAKGADRDKMKPPL
jgi:hypothetical protein